MAPPRLATHTDELPTLRLVTLRRLVRGTASPIVFDQETHVDEIEVALQGAPGAVVILVDGAGVLQGTLRLGDLRQLDPAARAAHVMSRGTPMIDAENDIEAARLLMKCSATDRLLVVTPTGELLGVVTDGDLATAPSRRRAA
jgi:CBS domain-containing protein